MTMDPVHDIAPGLDVHTQDGEELGTVENERVTMDFDHIDLDRYATSGPAEALRL